MTKIQLRRGLASEWLEANPVLGSGEHGFEKDTGRYKIGNGVSTWMALDYFIPLSEIDDKISRVGDDIPDLQTIFQNGLV